MTAPAPPDRPSAVPSATSLNDPWYATGQRPTPWQHEVAGRALSTPAVLQRANTYLLIALAIFAAVAAFAGVLWSNAAQATADNTAPALIGTQRLYSRVAEANAEAAAAHLSIEASQTSSSSETVTLSDSGDRLNRNAFLIAVEQATIEGEQVSATIGDDDRAHSALQDLNLALVTFTGRIEAARVLNLRSIGTADDELRAAIDVVATDLDPAVTVLNTQGREKLERERSSGREVGWLALALGLGTIAGLLWLQRELARRTKRKLNLGLVAATICVAAAVGTLWVASGVRANAISSASDGGLDPIVTTSQLQRSIYDLHSELTLQVIDGDTRSLEASVAAIDQGVVALRNGADSNREAAAAAALVTRWDRYSATAERISTLAGRDRTAASAAFRDVGVADFNGVNLAVESALSDNQAQFQDGVNTATEAVRLVPFAVVALALIAAVAIVFGIQQRLGEYR